MTGGRRDPRAPAGGRVAARRGALRPRLCRYFFQRHMAERFAAEASPFLRFDLRKYGRSLRPHQHPNFCRDVAEYYADLTAAIDAIGAPVLLAAIRPGGC